ncbi:pseudouridine synthase [Myxococcus sp. K15C18031901]|uniref:pseudouridine synthase n=1 Tax=Myxococcus dinghuensis TaxID=2906761 RepID=UPI0020A79BA8|nr:pseudouridine synthase [Myxococcus dinghuensis]MCP3102894.1 pseudouridine synthase [Myxococcus dinghuensis]
MESERDLPDDAGSLPSPFDELGPSALARRAAEVLQADLRTGHIAPGLSTSLLDDAEGGKMFGVLVVRRPEGGLGFLRAFSGMLAGRWDVEGYVPPLFDRELRERLEPEGEVTVKSLTVRTEAARTATEYVALRAESEALAERQGQELVALKQKHEARRQERHARRAALKESTTTPLPGAPRAEGPPVSAHSMGPRAMVERGGSGRASHEDTEEANQQGPHPRPSSDAQQLRAAERQGLAPEQRGPSGVMTTERLEADPSREDDARQRLAAALHSLDQESRGDKAERRRLDAAHADERQRIHPRLARLERRLRALERLRHAVSRALMRRIHDTYEVPNARGARRLLRTLFTPGEPPSGAADCAAPKLLAHAYALGLRPVALAEFWWGAPPPAGGRVSGAFYPACRDKCGPLLPFMLEGLHVAPPRIFTPPPPPARDLRVLFEDASLVIVDKPHGLLSVPGREASLSDSVLTRLRARHPRATGPLLVHRLDLDTSGLLVAALDARTHAALQRQFEQRQVHKRYVAWLEGRVEAEHGRIDLPIRVDLDDRPRQIHDPVHGKPAVTEWRVLERRGARTRVAFFPHTGRTHQLRVHASHPLGLGAPIVGDRLYGREDERLMLHAESLTFEHPETGRPVTFECPAPF